MSALNKQETEALIETKEFLETLDQTSGLDRDDRLRAMAHAKVIDLIVSRQKGQSNGNEN